MRLTSRGASSAPRPLTGVIALCAIALILSACGEDDETTNATEADPGASTAEVDGVFEIEGDRGLYARCTGTGSPTVVMEGGDGDTSDSYRLPKRKSPR